MLAGEIDLGETEVRARTRGSLRGHEADEVALDAVLASIVLSGHLLPSDPSYLFPLNE